MKRQNDFDSLGDQMKAYENAFTSQKAMKGIPLLARLDGKAFHTFTKGLNRPYDERLSKCMIETTKYLVEKTHALIGYTQSDEISLVWHLEAGSVSEFMFDGKIQKLVSTLAGMASSKFAKLIAKNIPEKEDEVPVFDCRVWQVPTKEIAADAFKWRELDATKNSISMAAHTYFSHGSLQGLNGSQKQELLFSGKGINWNYYPAFFKRGTYVQRKLFKMEFTKEELEKIPEKYQPTGPVLRTKVIELDMPPVRSCPNYTDVIFNAATPILKTE